MRWFYLNIPDVKYRGRGYEQRNRRRFCLFLVPGFRKIGMEGRYTLRFKLIGMGINISCFLFLLLFFFFLFLQNVNFDNNKSELQVIGVRRGGRVGGGVGWGKVTVGCFGFSSCKLPDSRYLACHSAAPQKQHGVTSHITAVAFYSLLTSYEI